MHKGVSRARDLHWAEPSTLLSWGMSPWGPFQLGPLVRCIVSVDFVHSAPRVSQMVKPTSRMAKMPEGRSTAHLWGESPSPEVGFNLSKAFNTEKL